MKSGYYIGMMSGTSLDGVDVVLAQLEEEKTIQLASITYPIPLEFRLQILSVCQGQLVTLSQLGQLDHYLGKLFAEAVLELLVQERVKIKTVVAIGSSGQTIWHQPRGEAPHSMQIGDNNLIAAMTGITVVGDFRRRDIALGGEGAPLVPAFHQAVFMHPAERRIVLNIGGIANITILFPGELVRGYDTGPGNILSDSWIYHHQGHLYDENGKWASQGHLVMPLLHYMLDDPWFALPPPKSTGREYFNLSWLKQQLANFPPMRPEDVQRTLVELTAVTIAEQVMLCGECDHLYVCGGGAHHSLLMSRIAAMLRKTKVGCTDELGIHSDSVEAMAFAWLASRTLSGLPGNLPAVTGARETSILGAIWPANVSNQ